MLSVNNKLWIISDTHWGHRNIIKFQQRPESHDVIMLSEWIARVKEDDQILHLGDVFMGKSGNPLRWASVISRLPGEKFLIKGNHDNLKNNVYTELAGFTVIEPFVKYGHAFTHFPISVAHPLFGANAERHPDGRNELEPAWHTNIHGHIHGNELNPLYGDKYIEGKTYINVSVEVMNLKPHQLGNIWQSGTVGERTVMV
jgi:calcineurin-like phosphoesterase family protein